MTTHAYDPIYLDNASRGVANMLHFAVCDRSLDGSDFLDRFIQSGIAHQFEAGNPKYIAGRSGGELFMEVMELTGEHPDALAVVEHYDRSDVYWTGWAMTHFQWMTNDSYRDILDAIPYEEWIQSYSPLHEADVRKVCDVMRERRAGQASRLRAMRRRCGMTQIELSHRSGVSVNTLRAYEQKIKDINKAQINHLQSIAEAMHCAVDDLLH